MWLYEAKLQYDAKVSVPDPRMAQLLIAQYGGPNRFKVDVNIEE
jgi:spore coat protein JC